MTTSNKNIVKEFIDRLFTEGDLSVLDELAAPSYVGRVTAPARSTWAHARTETPRSSSWRRRTAPPPLANTVELIDSTGGTAAAAAADVTDAAGIAATADLRRQLGV
jgi:hypothetical protein